VVRDLVEGDGQIGLRDIFPVGDVDVDQGEILVPSIVASCCTVMSV